MSRLLTAVAVAALIVIPRAAFAQKEPPRTKELRDAEKFMASALMTNDPNERRSRLERALNPLQQAMAKDPDNARVWFAAGQVYAGLQEYARADSAFDKAEQLYPAIAVESIVERLRAWATAFEAGLSLMDAAKHPEAIAVLENAEALYDLRPESKLNLGVLYMNKGDLARAGAAFRAALDVTDQQTPEGQTPEDVAQWKRFGGLARINLSSVLSQRGVEAFEAKRYDDAVGFFREARSLNPVARDYAYNLAQSFFAKARIAEESLAQLTDEEAAARLKKDAATAAAKSAQMKQLKTDLTGYYEEIQPLVEAARAFDPNNEDLFLLLMRSFKMRGDLSPDAAVKTNYNKRAGELLELHQKLGAEIVGIAAIPGNADAVMRGAVRNLKLTPGAPVSVQMALLGLDGSVVAQQDFVVKAPAVGEEAPFEGRANLTGDIAGWKYVIRLQP